MTNRNLCLLTAVAWCAFSHAIVAQESRGAQERVAPDAVFTTANGTIVRLSEFRGKQAVVLLFMRGFRGEFACYYCGLQTRAYKAGYDRLRALNVEVLLVLPGARDVAGYLKAVGNSNDERPDPAFAVPYRVVLDTDFGASRAFGVPFDPSESAPLPVSEPATVVVGRDGRVIFEHHGKNPGDRPALEAVLQALSGVMPGSSPASAESAPVATRSPIAWRTFEDGMKEAALAQKPLLLDFYAVW